MRKIFRYIKNFFEKLLNQVRRGFARILNLKLYLKVIKEKIIKICSNFRKFLAFTSIAVVFSVLLGILGLGGVFYFSRDLPNHDTLKDYFPKIKTKILSSDGYQIAEYYRENRAFIPFEFIPKKVINAFLAAEDKNFYKHHGVDFYGLIRSIIVNIRNVSANKRLVGGSTITQQVAKNFFLGNQRSFIRKIKEAILAYRIEMTLPKNRILEIYLNQFYFGQGCYGIVTAAKKYFNKSVEDLELHEIAYLAALVKGANNYHPIKHYNKAISRRNWVLKRELDAKMISKRDYQAYIKKPLITYLNDAKITNISEDSFVEEVRKQIVRQYGVDGLYDNGLLVRTTLNTGVQKVAKTALQDGILKLDKRLGFRGPVALQRVRKEDLAEYGFEIAEVKSVEDGQINITIRSNDDLTSEVIEYREGYILANNYKWAFKPDQLNEKLKIGDCICVRKLPKGEESYALEQIPEIQGAIVVMDQSNGHVIAMHGGVNFKNSEFNRAVQSQRQIGSLIKPFIYLTALSKGLTPATLVNAEYKTIDLGNKTLWTPRNAATDLPKELTLRKAIERSINTATIDVARYAGVNDIISTLKTFNVLEDVPDNLSFLLGSCESSLLQIVTSYAMIANGGYRVTPVLVESIQNKDGKCIYKTGYSVFSGFLTKWDKATKPPYIIDTRVKVFDHARVYQMISLLEGVVRRHSKEFSITMAGKTGTSNDSDNLWFVGFTPDIIVGVFVGYDVPRSVAKWAYGSTVALPIFKDFIKTFYKKKKSRPFKVPRHVEFKFVDPTTGQFANIYDKDAILEAFKSGDDPTFYPEPDTEHIKLLHLDFEYAKRIFKKLCK